MGVWVDVKRNSGVSADRFATAAVIGGFGSGVNRSPALAGQIFHLRATLKVSHGYIVVLFL